MFNTTRRESRSTTKRRRTVSATTTTIDPRRYPYGQCQWSLLARGEPYVEIAIRSTNSELWRRLTLSLPLSGFVSDRVSELVVPQAPQHHRRVVLGELLLSFRVVGWLRRCRLESTAALEDKWI